jgi:hypothetical protein
MITTLAAPPQKKKKKKKSPDCVGYGWWLCEGAVL